MIRIPKPESGDGGGGGEFNPFLKVDHIGKKGATAMLTGTVGELRKSTFAGRGDNFSVELKLNGTVYDWTVTMNTPNHRELFERFGQNPKKWAGKKLRLIVNPPMKKGFRPYIAIEREA